MASKSLKRNKKAGRTTKRRYGKKGGGSGWGESTGLQGYLKGLRQQREQGKKAQMDLDAAKKKKLIKESKFSEDANNRGHSRLGDYYDNVSEVKRLTIE